VFRLSRIPRRFDFINLTASKRKYNYQVFSAIKYYSNDQTNEVKMGRTCTAHGNMRVTYKILVGKPERGHLGDTGIEMRM